MPISITRNGTHKLQKSDGTQISSHSAKEEAYERASSQPNGTYKLITADETIVVSGTTPTPPPNQPPTITLTSPAPGTSVVVGTTIQLAATAADPDGTIASVRFVVDNTTVIASDVTAPYTASWTPPAAGVFGFTAIAQDNAGATTATSSVAVTVTAVPVPPVPGQRTLLGGWRIPADYSNATIAIDFARMKLWVNGNNSLLEFNLPAFGPGTDITTWPKLTPVATVPRFWDANRGYVNGLCWWQGKLWATNRVFYAIPGDPNAPMHPDTKLFAQDGQVLTIALPQQQFGGFVKRGPNQDPYIGCGGYESGQGSVSGPTLATLTGQKLIGYGWPASPGAVGANGKPANWDQRAPRDPNYSVVRAGTNIVEDSWVGWNPRTINGVLEGRWACDRIDGGGLVLPEGITYWARVGTGKLDYAIQSYTFAPANLNKVYAYRYDPTTFALLDYTHISEFDPKNHQNINEWIGGQELGPDGRVYLCQTQRWSNGTTEPASPILMAFG